MKENFRIRSRCLAIVCILIHSILWIGLWPVHLFCEEGTGKSCSCPQVTTDSNTGGLVSCAGGFVTEFSGSCVSNFVCEEHEILTSTSVSNESNCSICKVLRAPTFGPESCQDHSTVPWIFCFYRLNVTSCLRLARIPKCRGPPLVSMFFSSI